MRGGKGEGKVVEGEMGDIKGVEGGKKGEAVKGKSKGKGTGKK